MCGIAGYIGTRNAVDVVFDQLKRLEYRGYDSAGVAFVQADRIGILKRAGKLTQLGGLIEQEKPEANLAIAHSRWATHGGPTDFNAHPHYDQQAKIALIHNGIIENYLELKEELVRAGHTFQSETDTEVAAHIIGREYVEGVSLEDAVRKAVQKMRGAFGFVVISHLDPEKLVCARNASPLVVGLGEGENMVASDIPALLPYTRRVAILENDMVATVTRGEIKVIGLDGRKLELSPFEVDWDIAAAEKGGYDHFMLKEIHEQPAVVRSALAGRIEGHGVALQGLFSDHVWQEIDRVVIIACGTAFHAGLMGKTLFERVLQLPTDVYFSSEFRYGEPVVSPRSLAVFISQSGETADSLAALRLCKSRRIRTLGIVNVVGSSIARECDRTIMTQAGPEISVASTKAYTAQCIVLLLLALHIAQVKETPGVRVGNMVQDLRNFTGYVQASLSLESEMREVAEMFQDAKLVFFLGRNADAHVSLEAALKLKEVAYVPTQECPAGEMKHGPLALIEPGVLAVFGATDSDVREKTVSNMKEVQARGGYVLALTTEDDSSLDSVADRVVKVPKSGSPYLNALVSIVPLQLLAYYVAKARGCEIDQPRNLAKSVTVE
ncbi:MAG: glutamine--fructose-6-phosphate transaminase (isomerizing) [Fimbriimonadaceae bacterium]|jgi:glucosamine--fructose-6-phosphate aminotransferase (isomerizing)|nr:glutamine--fructose-6-phosphate transaminase (isomerizing) [Fimbriimonadaceae bacterium]